MASGGHCRHNRGARRVKNFRPNLEYEHNHICVVMPSDWRYISLSRCKSYDLLAVACGFTRYSTRLVTFLEYKIVYVLSQSLSYYHKYLKNVIEFCEPVSLQKSNNYVHLLE